MSNGNKCSLDGDQHSHLPSPTPKLLWEQQGPDAHSFDSLLKLCVCTKTEICIHFCCYNYPLMDIETSICILILWSAAPLIRPLNEKNAKEKKCNLSDCVLSARFSNQTAAITNRYTQLWVLIPPLPQTHHMPL